ncbi:hypothetical protein GSY69_09275 [Brevibacterium sp. 5221]|uniref:FlgD Ig-like domain-containing protein n=1 Tax=Brevibacterium rongguiense TaxID=2695267 RepID=A0A6N9H857_9MICO|nr:hypothetical protein [Brevibacterium rongguiense]MYM20153.1 hypothetical protein [Brevibacterium rongguiense]
MRARLSIPAALAALAVAGTAFTGFSAPASAAPSASAQTSATARTVSAPPAVRANYGCAYSASAQSTVTFTRVSAESSRASRVKAKPAHKRISRSQLARHGMKIRLTGLKKRARVDAASDRARSCDANLSSSTVRASASGKATVKLKYWGHSYDRRGRNLSKGTYIVVVSQNGGTQKAARGTFRVY